LVEAGSWPKAPKEAIILGLKELPEGTDPIAHDHIFFAHCFKGQDGWRELMQRFLSGGSTIYDLEFLKRDGMRVAAFGRPAGIIGCAAGVLLWAHQQRQRVRVAAGEKAEPMPALRVYESEDALVAHVVEQLEAVRQLAGQELRTPVALVMGSLGRVGGGAVHFLQRLGALVDVVAWDKEETQKGGPFKEIAEADIFVNSIYLEAKIAPFIDLATVLATPGRRLTAVSDVSCDYTSPNNPIAIYENGTTFEQPDDRVIEHTADQLPLAVIAIDHLPTLLPRESSVNYGEQMLEHLLNLAKLDSDPVWQGAKEDFKRIAAQV
jgi:saccharopine dehydrogenase (NAD+, L-lysine forming)